MAGDMAEAGIIRGRAFAPGRSRSEPAELRLAGGSVTLHGPDGAERGRLPRGDLRFDPPLGSAPRRATLPDGTLFETAEDGAVRALAGQDGWDRLHGVESWHPRLVLVVAATAAAGWAIWRWGLDLMAAAAVAMTPAAAVDAVDAGTLRTLDLVLGSESRLSPDRRAAALTILDRLTGALDPATRAAHDFRLEFRTLAGLGPNAIALPGGTIVVSDELLSRFPSADVQAGVISHEIAHVTEAHGLTQVYRSLGIAALVAFLAGDTVGVVEDILLEGNVLLSLTFSRAAESEADMLGLALAARAGYDPEGLVTFFDWLEAEIGDEASWLSTHPSSAARKEAIRRAIAAE